MKLVHLEGVTAIVHQMTRLVNDARLAQQHELLALVHRYLLLELITARPAIDRRAFDGEKRLTVTQTHPDGAAVTTADVALPDVA